MGKRVSRRRFLALTAGGAAALGGAALLEPLLGFWSRVGKRLGLIPPPPAPSVPGRSAIYRVDGMPRPTWRPADDPAADWQATHAGVEALLDLMGEQGLPFYRSAAQGTDRRSGPDGLVGPDDVVLIKVNAQWKRRGMTSTDVVRGLIRAVLAHPDGFRGEVVIVENGQWKRHLLAEEGENNDDFEPDHPQSFADVAALFAAQGFAVSIYPWSDHRNQVREWDEGDEEAGYVMAGPYPLNYPKFTTAYGTRISLRRGIWDGERYDNDRLTFINLPVLKHHDWFGTTAAVKNFLGVMSKYAGVEQIGGKPEFHDALIKPFNGLPPGLPGSLMALRFPDLNIVDATYVGVWGNRTDQATYERSPRQGTLLAGRDPVALDYYAAREVLGPLKREAGLPRYQQENGDPDKDGLFRRYLIASQERLLEAGYTVRFGPDAFDLFSTRLS